MHEDRLNRLAVCRSVAAADALLSSNNQRNLCLAAEDESCLRHLVEDLIHRDKGEVHIHQFYDRTHACAGGTESGTDHLCFRDRCIKAALCAELIRQASRTSPDAAQNLNVFAHNKNALVTFHFR